MKNKDYSKSSIKELKTVEKPSLEKLSLDELSYLAAGGFEISTDNRLNSVTLVSEPHKITTVLDLS